MVFGSRQIRSKLAPFSLHFMGKELFPVNTVKDLGIFLDSNLTIDEHVTKSVSSCMHRLSQVNRAKHIINKHALLTIINSLVFSKLFYCSNVWSSTSKCNITKLQRIQNFACRIVCRARKYEHVTPFLKKLNRLPVASKLYLRDAIMTFKCMAGRAPKYLSSQFIKREEVSSRKAKNCQMLHIPFFKTSSGQKIFYFRSVDFWNNLDHSFMICNSIRVFKHRLIIKIRDNF